MKQFLDKDFLLSTDMAKTIYHDYRRKYADLRLSLPYQPTGDL